MMKRYIEEIIRSFLHQRMTTKGSDLRIWVIDLIHDSIPKEVRDKASMEKMRKEIHERVEPSDDDGGWSTIDASKFVGDGSRFFGDGHRNYTQEMHHLRRQLNDQIAQCKRDHEDMKDQSSKYREAVLVLQDEVKLLNEKIAKAKNALVANKFQTALDILS